MPGGRFCLNANGEVAVETVGSGRILEPTVVVPNDATRVVISAEGTVSFRFSSSTQLQQVATIQLAKFINPQGLRRIGENLYAETDGGGAAMLDKPGANGIGTLRQGWIEESNVDLRREIAEWKRVRRMCRELRGLLVDDLSSSHSAEKNEQHVSGADTDDGKLGGLRNGDHTDRLSELPSGPKRHSEPRQQ